MSHLSRFDLSFDKPEKQLPPMRSSASVEAGLEQLSHEICDLDPNLAEILFSVPFSKQSREEKLAAIEAWAGG